jgi:hypothetical protein
MNLWRTLGPAALAAGLLVSCAPRAPRPGEPPPPPPATPAPLPPIDSTPHAFSCPDGGAGEGPTFRKIERIGMG